jgi:hypothetical protein
MHCERWNQLTCKAYAQGRVLQLLPHRSRPIEAVAHRIRAGNA